MLAGYRGTRLDQIWNTNVRNVGMRVCIWNPRKDNVQDVVRNEWTGGRYDISQFVENVNVTQNQVFENNSDSVSSRATISIAIDDKEGILIGTTRIKVDQKLFTDGTPIRIYEGDLRIAKEDWPCIFTGIIRGFPGAHTAMTGQPRKISVQAFGRAQTFQRQQIVGVSFAEGSDFGDMAVETAMTEMSLSREEIKFGKFDKTVKHNSNALTQIGKLEGLYEIMKPVKRKPYFDAEGFLVSHDTSFGKPASWFFRGDQIKSISRVQNLGQQVNSVEVTGLDFNLTEIVQSFKKILDVRTTVGYFDPSYVETIYYSDDKTRRVKNPTVHTVKRPGFGGSASLVEIDEFSSKLVLNTGYAPEVLGLVTVVYVAASLIEYFCDLYIAGSDVFFFDSWFAQLGEGVVAVIRFWAQLAKNAALVAAMVLMQRIGRWHVEIHGQPFENVYQELRAIAVRKGTLNADIIERKETIHWLSTLDDVKDMAKTLLQRELIKSQSYQIVCASVPVLEVDDIIEITAPNHGFPRPSRFYVTSIDRSLSANNKDGLMRIRAWQCKEEMPQ